MSQLLVSCLRSQGIPVPGDFPASSFCKGLALRTSGGWLFRELRAEKGQWRQSRIPDMEQKCGCCSAWLKLISFSAQGLSRAQQDCVCMDERYCLLFGRYFKAGVSVLQGLGLASHVHDLTPLSCEN